MRIVDLRDLEPRRLLPLFRAEAREWSLRLHWRRDRFLRGIRSRLRRRQIPGLALADDRVPVAKVVVAASEDACSLELPYSPPGPRAAEDLSLLLCEAVDRSLARPGARRVDASFFLTRGAALTAPFSGRGFRTLERDYLVLQLRGGPIPPALEPPTGIHLAGARGSRDWPAILHAAYVGTTDREACVLYRSRHGCAAYLDTLLRGREYGRFEPTLSASAADGAGDTVGFLLATSISVETLHLAQIAVRPDWQGRGVGRALLARYLLEARRRGWRRSTLLVTRAHARARRWYLRQGYRERLPFFCAWWEDVGTPQT